MIQCFIKVAQRVPVEENMMIYVIEILPGRPSSV